MHRFFISATIYPVSVDPVPAAHCARLKESRTKILRLLILAILALDLLAVGSILSYESGYNGRIHAGVTALGVDLSGKPPAEGRAALTARLSQKQVISLRDGSQRYTLALSELGIQPDVDTLLDAAYAVGREAEWDANLADQFQAQLDGRSVSAALMIDDGTAQVALKRLARQIERVPRDATVSHSPTSQQVGQPRRASNTSGSSTKTSHGWAPPQCTAAKMPAPPSTPRSR